MLRRALFHNFRLLQRSSAWLRRRLTPAGSLIAGGLIAAGVFGIDTRASLAYQIVGLFAGLLLVAALGTLRFRPRLHLRRTLPEFATAGQPLSYGFRIENRGGRPLADLTLVDELRTPLPSFAEFMRAPDPGAGRINPFDRFVGYPRWLALLARRRGADTEPAPLPLLAPCEAAEVKLQLEPHRRGYVHFSSAYLLRPDALGLLNAVRKAPLPQSLLVLPRRYEVPQPALAGHRRYQPGGVSLASAVGDSQEFIALREYRPGDPLRHIHWRSWARTGGPVVKEFQDEFFVRHALILDTFGPHDEAVFEEAVSLAASFAAAPRSPDALLELMFVGIEAHSFSSGRSLAGAEHLLEILACVEPCTGHPFSALTELVLGHEGQLSGCICVLANWDAPRRALVTRLDAAGLPLLVVALRPAGMPVPDAGPLRGRPQCFLALEAGRVPEGLHEYAARTQGADPGGHQ